MSRTKKKRNKAYTGQDAASTSPTVHRIKAVDRHPVHQWWFEKKRFVKPVAVTLVVVAIIVWLLAELLRITLQ